MQLFGSRQQACAHCGKNIGSDVRFCPYCGQPTEVNAGGCPHCGQPVAANARFCPRCGRQLGGARAPDLRGSVWRKSADEFAVRVEPADLRGAVYKEVEVQPGQQVVLLVDGQADNERQGPGRYTVDSLFDRLLTLGAGRHVTGLLVDGGYVSLEFQISEVFTHDDYAVSARCVVGVQVANPVAFFANVMKSQRTLTVADLRGFLFDEVRDAVQEVVRNRDLRDLATNLALRDSLADAVDVYLNNTLATSGLDFGGVRTVEFHHPRLEALRKQWEEIRLARDEAVAGRTQERERKLAEIQKRTELWEAQQVAEDQETREQRAKARLFEERAQVYDEIRRAAMSDQMNQVKSAEDYRDFLAQVNGRQVLRQEELDKLAEDFTARKADRANARAHTAYLAELERDYNRKQAELVWRTDFTLEQMAAGLKVEQQKLADEGMLDERRWQNDLASMLRTGEKADWQRAEQQKQVIFDRRREKDAQGHRQELEKAQTLHGLELRAIETDAELTDAQKRKKVEVELQRYEAERRGIQRQIEAADFDERRRQTQADDEDDMKLAAEAVDLLAKMKKNKLSVEEEARRIAREDELTRADAALKAEMARKEAERQEKAQAQGHELAMLQARAQMSAEALMSLSAPDQARAIADLKKTEAMKGMSDEQVYALMAAQSPAVAQALAERFKAAAARPAEVDAQTRALYERMLADIQKDREKDADLRQRTEDRFQQMFAQALESQRSGMVEIARATGGQQQTPPTIIFGPGAAGPNVIQPSPGGPLTVGPTGGRVQICPHCRVEVLVGLKFCSNCGHAFYE